jgi:hypothetical protein
VRNITSAKGGVGVRGVLSISVPFQNPKDAPY